MRAFRLAGTGSAIAGKAAAAALFAGIVAGGARALAVTTVVPLNNPSFESPATPFVSTHVDGWQKTQQDPGYDSSGGYLWDQLAGVFQNPAPGQSDHIDNIDGVQAVWIFNVRGFGMFQDYGSHDWAGTNALHTPDAVFSAGSAYRLTVGVFGGGGGMPEGAPLELALYHRDDSGAPALVSSNLVVNSTNLFPTPNHFFDFSVRVPEVKATDPWAGRHVGVLMLSTVEPSGEGGYWDVDHVRLFAITPAAPKVILEVIANGGARVDWVSEADVAYQVRISRDLASWSDAGAPQSGTGGPLSATIAGGDGGSLYVEVTATPVP
jgi:hypothetical protein